MGSLQVLVLQGAQQLTHFGRHQRKLDLVSGSKKEIVKDDTATTHAAVRPPSVQLLGLYRVHHSHRTTGILAYSWSCAALPALMFRGSDRHHIAAEP